MIEPMTLNSIYVLDALIYGVVINAMTQSATIYMEIDPEFHAGIPILTASPPEGPRIVDFIFSGATRATVSRMPRRNAAWKDDEKPHDYEISDLRVQKLTLGNGYRLRVRCHLGQRIEIVFDSVDVRLSDRSPGATHQYERAHEERHV